MDLDAFDFDLPADRIALRPARPRSAARLLVADGAATHDAHVADLGRWLRPGDLLVFNDTAVIPARLHGHRHRPGAETTPAIEATLIRRLDAATWVALARPGKRLAPGDRLDFQGLGATVRARRDSEVTLAFDAAGPALDAGLAAVGTLPLPPYIARARAVDAADTTDYQTVFATHPGAVAAPTAALHFDDALLADLAARGVTQARLTLHVGAGTFLPVKTDRLADHTMHAEWGEITPQAAAAINAARAAGGRIIAVGTTVLRLLESAATPDGRIQPWRGDTAIFLTPGHRFRAIDGLMTNFHLPRSTLFVLVAALMGLDRMQALYAHAIATGYRFYSYGDASLLLPDAANCPPATSP